MSNESYILLENTSTIDSSFNFSDKNKGAGYHKFNNGVHTYVYATSDFIGTIKLQGTLEEFPGDDDWVDISVTEETGSSNGSFTGNFLWIRAAYTIENGSITQIRYNF